MCNVPQNCYISSPEEEKHESQYMTLLWRLTLQTKLSRNPYYANSGEFFQQTEPYIKERASKYISWKLLEWNKSSFT